MVDIATLQERLAELRALRANGVRTVEHGDKSVTFRNDAEMSAAIQDLERQIAAAAGSTVRRILPTTSKGL